MTSTGLILLGLASVGFAQPARPPAPPQMAFATLHLTFDRHGGAQATLRLTPAPPDSTAGRRALAAALRIPPDQVREESPLVGLLMLETRADGILDRDGWLVEGAIEFAPLLDYLKQSKVATLWLFVIHPDGGFNDCSLPPLFAPWNQKRQYYGSLPADPSTPPLRLAFGYRPTYAWRFLPLAAVLLIPLALTLWRRSQPPKAEEDRFRTWFRAWQFHGWLIVALWGAWLAAVNVLGGVKLAGFVLWRLLPSDELAWTWVALVMLLPPALTTLACKVLLAPAFAGVPKMGWTRGLLLRQALWRQLGVVAIGVCLAYSLPSNAGLPRLNNLPSGQTWLGLVAALGLLIVCIPGSLQFHNILAPGELRERLFELADQGQVRVRQAHVLSAEQWRLLPAVIDLPGAAYVTPDVLPHLSRREVDAVLALELARLRGRRGGLWAFPLSLLIGLTIGSLIGGAFGALLFFGFFGGADSVWTALPLLVPVGMAVIRCRRSPYLAPVLDGEVLTITGDPEALLTALAKLRRLELLPVGAEEKGSASVGDPAEWPRLRELAERAGIPEERLREILARLGSGEDRYPPLPALPSAAPEADSRVFSLAVKRRISARQVWAKLVLEIAVPALVAYFVQLEHWHGVKLAVAYLAGLLLAVFIPRFAVRRMAARTTRALQRGIRDKLARDGLKPETWGGIFVSLSPHAEPRNYESFLVWDFGFLVLVGDRLCYLGDRTRFALDRASIEDATIGPGAVGWRPRRVYVTWRDDERGMGGVFNLVLSERGSPRRSAAKAAVLLRRLRDWRGQLAVSSEVPPPLRELPTPDFGAVASEALGKLAAGNILLGALIHRAPFAIGTCFLLGLSFTREGGAGGWYVLLTVALLQIRAVVSFRRYRGGRRDDFADADAAADRGD